MMDEILDQIQAARVMPILGGMHAEHAEPMADALVSNGLMCTELTLRNPEAFDAVRLMARRKDLVVGAGTVLTVEMARHAVEAGAKFLVSPAVNPAVVRWAIDNETPIIPGVATPADIERAMGLGIDVLKFFPAEPLGGATTLAMYSSIYRNVRFMPTGGITLEKVPQYLALDSVASVGGSWILGKNLLRDGKFEQIAELVRQTVALIRR